ncbi:hypothetical protein Salmuc_02344 [Salipiger mucosus DSM 16094]|uniref:Uncharacterized protein n=1 Tax=Salipiger mucosus DSM 16094 TaxID=1123237 RepID=S9Q8J0_9RHOB|nr:hypothetical protein Salmuc_02344 [Salipiger mucosus DSM 16094]
MATRRSLSDDELSPLAREVFDDTPRHAGHRLRQQLLARAGA